MLDLLLPGIIIVIAILVISVIASGYIKSLRTERLLFPDIARNQKS